MGAVNYSLPSNVLSQTPPLYDPLELAERYDAEGIAAIVQHRDAGDFEGLPDWARAPWQSPRKALYSSESEGYVYPEENLYEGGVIPLPPAVSPIDPFTNPNTAPSVNTDLPDVFTRDFWGQWLDKNKEIYGNMWSGITGSLSDGGALDGLADAVGDVGSSAAGAADATFDAVGDVTTGIGTAGKLAPWFVIGVFALLGYLIATGFKTGSLGAKVGK